MRSAINSQQSDLLEVRALTPVKNGAAPAEYRAWGVSAVWQVFAIVYLICRGQHVEFCVQHQRA